MKVFHTGDIHICQKHLKWVKKALSFAITDAIDRDAEVAAITGDSFDSSINLHEPAVTEFFEQILRLADAMPVILIAGTASHDRPGSLNPLRAIGGKHPVFVADTICQVALLKNKIDDSYQWLQSEGFTFTELPDNTVALFSVLPSVNKGALAASVGTENVAAKAAELIYEVCKGWAPSNLMARKAGISTALLGHGTVSGCTTESKHAMVSPDHEFSTGTLFAAETVAVMLSHIHRHQFWQQDNRLIAYSSSITKLVHGHDDPVGYPLWDVQPDKASFEFIETPCMKLIEIEFDGPPDMDELREAAKNADGAHVRVRWEIDEDFKASIDREAIKELFANADNLKLEGRINPVVRKRSAGINKAQTLHEKLEKWADVTETGYDPLAARLSMLESMEPEQIVAELLEPKVEQEAA